MPTFLSQAWLDALLASAAGLPERPGASARVQHVVSGAPGGEVRYRQTFVDGRLTEASLGEDPEAEVTLQEAYADAVQVARGELDPNAAFMQGRVKVVGDMGKVMALVPLTQSDEYLAALAEVSAQTEY